MDAEAEKVPLSSLVYEVAFRPRRAVRESVVLPSRPRVYNQNMNIALLTSPEFLLHDTGSHVENAGRLRAVESELKGLEGLTRRLPRLASDEELLRLHEPEVLERVRRASAAGGQWLDGDTFCSKDSDRVARLAVGGTLDLVSSVLSGEFERAFALGRPPGHHATPERSMGFCLFSTIALAARHAVVVGGLERVFIFDWDVHHGNGTQDCLYSDPSTCFCSFHQSPFYPGSGALRERGERAGEDLTYNLPLPAGMGDAEYLYAMEELVKPVLLAYDPQLILVSAGYDAHRDDPLGGMRVTTGGFRKMARLISLWSNQTAAQGRIVGVLEGGYDAVALGQSVRATLEAWMETPVATAEAPAETVSHVALKRIQEARKAWGIS